MKYSWLLFDADGTLFDYDKAESAALRKTFSGFDLRFRDPYLALYQRFNGQLWSDFEKGLVSQQEIRTRRFELLFDEIGQSCDLEAFGELYLVHLAQGTDLIDGAHEVVRALYGRVGLLIITNGIPEVQRPRFGRSAIRDYFADVVISGEVSAAKPSPRIFDAAFEIMGDPARDQVLIVGDSLTSDIAGGSSYGIGTCWFNPAGDPRPSAPRIDHEIGTLDQLLTLPGLQ
jgi:YjjG family noncanonical pyrimidine nucleotidase